MRNRVPVPASERPPIPEFAPVPRIEALADCGSVTRRPMAQVNMAQANCCALRRAPGAGEGPMAIATIGTIRRSRSRA